MNKTLLAIVPLVCVFGLYAFAVNAQDPTGDAVYMLEGTFEELDADSDGVVTHEEFLKSTIDLPDNLKVKVKELDRDSDGVITEEEFKAHQNKILERFRYCNVCDVDSNSDAFLSDEEFEHYYNKNRRQFFDRMDRDRDGSISHKEWTLFRF